MKQNKLLAWGLFLLAVAALVAYLSFGCAAAKPVKVVPQPVNDCNSCIVVEQNGV